MQKKKRLYNVRNKRKREKQKRDNKKHTNLNKKRKVLSKVQKGKGKAKVDEPEAIDANKCPICDMKWEDDDGENGEWLGCKYGQWLDEECIDYKLTNPYLICPDCV